MWGSGLVLGLGVGLELGLGLGRVQQVRWLYVDLVISFGWFACCWSLFES